jgi:flagellar hook-associated protein 2
MPSISSMGTGSGIDIRSLIDKLVAAEGEARVKKLDRDEASKLNKITGYSNLKSALSDFKLTLGNLKDIDELTKRTATSQDPSIFTAQVNSGNIKSASYNIQVNALAKTQKCASIDFASSTTTVGTGTLIFTMGSTSYSLDIGTQDQTLSGIKDKINDSFSDVGISANLVTVDTGTRLILSSKRTGVENGFTVSVSNDGDLDNSNSTGLSQLISSRLTVLQAASDASIKIDNLTVTSPENYIEEAIDGVTLNLVKADLNVDYKLDLSLDKSNTRAKITDFVNGYNTALLAIRDLSGYQTNGFEGQAGVLIGDATIRSIQSNMRKEINTSISTDTNGFKLLSQIGITTNSKTGELEINTTKLNDCLEKNFDGVGKVFANTEDGLAARMDKALGAFTQTGGVLYSRIIGMNESIIDIKKQRVELEMRLQKLEQRLVSQFTAMDSIISGLNNMGDFLKRAIDGLPEPNSVKK